MTEHPTPGEEPQSNDVVLLLQQRHERISALFEEVIAATGKERRKGFHRLAHLLAVHETAEEEVVHPYARRVLEHGAEVVAARLEEENSAKRALRRLEHADPEDPKFTVELTALRDGVPAHAAAEEGQEFPALRASADQARLQVLAKAVRAAEVLAPNRPHPGVESAAGNLALGPVAAAADLARDAVRKVLGQS